MTRLRQPADGGLPQPLFTTEKWLPGTNFPQELPIRPRICYNEPVSRSQLAIIYLTGTATALLLETLLSKLHYRLTRKHYKEHHFSLAKYLFYLSFPLLGALLIVLFGNFSLLKVFLVFSGLGTFFEFLGGFAYQRVVGQRLWTYHRLSLGGYTSLLSLPLWGMAGVAAALVSEALK